MRTLHWFIELIRASLAILAEDVLDCLYTFLLQRCTAFLAGKPLFLQFCGAYSLCHSQRLLQARAIKVAVFCMDVCCAHLQELVETIRAAKGIQRI